MTIESGSIRGWEQRF